jgi:hypothetical protein
MITSRIVLAERWSEAQGPLSLIRRSGPFSFEFAIAMVGCCAGVAPSADPPQQRIVSIEKSMPEGGREAVGRRLASYHIDGEGGALTPLATLAVGQRPPALLATRLGD